MADPYKKTDQEITWEERLSGDWIRGNDGNWYLRSWIEDPAFPSRRMRYLGQEAPGTTKPGQLTPGRERRDPYEMIGGPNIPTTLEGTDGWKPMKLDDFLGSLGFESDPNKWGIGWNGITVAGQTVSWGDLLKAGITAFMLVDYMKQRGARQEMIDKAMQYYEEDQAARAPYREMLGGQIKGMVGMPRPDLSQAFGGTSNPFARPIERAAAPAAPTRDVTGARDIMQDRDQIGGPIVREPEPPVNQYAEGRRKITVEEMIGSPPSIGGIGEGKDEEMQMATAPTMQLPEWLKKYLGKVVA